jgi:hypothetical protein
MLVVNDCPRVLVGVADRVRIFWVKREVMRFYQLRNDLPNSEAFEKRNQLKIDSDTRAEDDGFRRCANRVLDFVWPDVFDGLFQKKVSACDGGAEDPAVHIPWRVKVQGR